MPTPKSVRFHYKRLKRRLWLLEKALAEAHEADVIEYPDGNFAENAPCASASELRRRIEKTTEKSRANAFREECMADLRDAW